MRCCVLQPTRTPSLLPHVQDEAHLCRLVRLAALAGGDAVEHCRVHAQLALAQVVDVLVHCVLSDETVHLDRPRLAQPVAPVLRLPVDLWVEVHVCRGGGGGRAQGVGPGAGICSRQGLPARCASYLPVRRGAPCRMTVSAPVRLRPWPPARVDSRKANTSSLWLKRSTVASRSSTAARGRGEGRRAWWVRRGVGREGRPTARAISPSHELPPVNLPAPIPARPARPPSPAHRWSRQGGRRAAAAPPSSIP